MPQDKAAAEGENAELAAELRRLQDERAAEQPQVAALAAEQQALYAENQALNKTQAALSSEVRGLKAAANALTDEASALRYKLSQARGQGELLRGQIVHSPQKVAALLGEISAAVERERAMVADAGGVRWGVWCGWVRCVCGGGMSRSEGGARSCRWRPPWVRGRQMQQPQQLVKCPVPLNAGLSASACRPPVARAGGAGRPGRQSGEGGVQGERADGWRGGRGRAQEGGVAQGGRGCSVGLGLRGLMLGGGGGGASGQAAGSCWCSAAWVTDHSYSCSPLLTCFRGRPPHAAAGAYRAAGGAVPHQARRRRE